MSFLELIAYDKSFGIFSSSQMKHFLFFVNIKLTPSKLLLLSVDKKSYFLLVESIISCAFVNLASTIAAFFNKARISFLLFPLRFDKLV